MSNMRKLVLASAVVVLIGGGAKADTLFREAADFFKFDGSEFFTTTTAASFPASPQGSLFFTRTLTPNGNSDVLFVSVFATGDERGGAKSWLSCQVNGIPCKLSASVATDGAPKGWIALHHLPTGGDNDLAYQWCTVIAPGPVTVDLRLATSAAGSQVAIEKGHVFIDSTKLGGPNRCVNVVPPAGAAVASEESDPMALALKARAAKGDNVAGSKNHQ